jgi:putative transposase
MTIHQYAKKQTKTAVAIELGVSRSSLYYKPKKPDKVEKLKNDILALLKVHPAYGHRRVAIALKRNKKTVRAVMKTFGIKPRRTRHKPFKKHDMDQEEMKIPNLIKNLEITHENQVWCSDFTYIWFSDRYLYLATVIDIHTREILGFAMSTRHDTDLIQQALEMAHLLHGRPLIFHSDQGSEYRSQKFMDYVKNLKIQISMSKKGSPWENGYQESFYSGFKLDLGHPECFDSLGELIAHITQTIHYYNHDRIHLALKMPPSVFAAQIKKSHHADNLIH